MVMAVPVGVTVARTARSAVPSKTTMMMHRLLALCPSHQPRVAAPVLMRIAAVTMTMAAATMGTMGTTIHTAVMAVMATMTAAMMI